MIEDKPKLKKWIKVEFEDRDIDEDIDTLVWIIDVYLKQLERRYGKGNDLPREIRENYTLANAAAKHAKTAQEEIGKVAEILKRIGDDVVELSYPCSVKEGHE